MDILRKYAEDSKAGQLGPLREDSIQAQLKRRLQEHQSYIDRITALLALLERNPDFEKMINLSRDLL